MCGRSAATGSRSQQVLQQQEPLRLDVDDIPARQDKFLLTESQRVPEGRSDELQRRQRV